MALADVIEQELLRTLDGEGDAQEVLDRYAGSKGPLYAALARAVPAARSRFRDVQGRLRDLQERERALSEQVRALEDRTRELEQRDAELQRAVHDKEALLAQAAAVEAAGLNAEGLETLGALLARVAEHAAVSPPEAVARFLEAAADYEQLTAFGRQVAAAQERAEAAEARTRKLIEESRLTEEAIEAGRWLARQRISPEILRAWRQVATRLKLPPEELAEGLAGALERYGSLEAACREAARTRDALATEIEKLQGEKQALQAERERIAQALEAVAEQGSRRLATAEEKAAGAVERIGRKAAEELARLRKAFEEAVDEAASRLAETMARHEALAREAAELGRLVDLARALTTREPAAWAALDAETVGTLLVAVGRWSRTVDLDPEVPPPEVCQGYPGVGSFHRLRLRQILAWAGAAVEEAGRQALQAAPREGTGA